MANILYFEGAGMDFQENEFSDVGNYRIRTAFTNLEGVQYYIELGHAVRTNKKGKVLPEWGLRIDHLFKIADRGSDEYEIKTDYLAIRKLDYTKEAITEWINQNLNCNFDTIEVLDLFHGYRVHSDRGYNLIEGFKVDHGLALRRKRAYNKVDREYREALDERYSKIGLLNMDDKSVTIRCYASDRVMSNSNLPRIKTVEI